MATFKDDYVKQLEATNELLIEMAKNQKESSKNSLKMYIVTIICLTSLLITMVVGFILYESQYHEIDDNIEQVETITTTQEVSGENSKINNVMGDMFNDNASKNYFTEEMLNNGSKTNNNYSKENIEEKDKSKKIKQKR